MKLYYDEVEGLLMSTEQIVGITDELDTDEYDQYAGKEYVHFICKGASIGFARYVARNLGIELIEDRLETNPSG